MATPLHLNPPHTHPRRLITINHPLLILLPTISSNSSSSSRVRITSNSQNTHCHLRLCMLTFTGRRRATITIMRVTRYLPAAVTTKGIRYLMASKVRVTMVVTSYLYQVANNISQAITKDIIHLAIGVKVKVVARVTRYLYQAVAVTAVTAATLMDNLRVATRVTHHQLVTQQVTFSNKTNKISSSYHSSSLMATRRLFTPKTTMFRKPII